MPFMNEGEERSGASAMPTEESEDPAADSRAGRFDYRFHCARSRVSYAIHIGAIAFLAIRLVPVWKRFGYLVQYETDWYESPRTGIAMLIAIGSWLVAFESGRRLPTRQDYGAIERWSLGFTLVFMLVVLFYFCEFLMFWQLGPSS